MLIDAFDRLPHNAALVVYGNEAAFPDYVAQLKAAAKHSHIRFAGPLDHRDVGQVLGDLVDHPDQMAAMRTNIRPVVAMPEHARHMLEVYQR